MSWHVIFSGIFLQAILGLLILRWQDGFKAFEWFGNKAVDFLDYTSAGSDFVFGERFGLGDPNVPPSWTKHGFVMQV